MLRDVGDVWQHRRRMSRLSAPMFRGRRDVEYARCHSSGHDRARGLQPEVSGHYPKRFPLLSALLTEGAA